MKDTLDAAEVAFFGEIQKMLFARRAFVPEEVSRICAVDAAYRDDRVIAVASLFEDGRLLEKASCSGRCSLPYVSGLFYLREGPFVTEAVRRLTVQPQLVCFDAHGAAHPRSAGLATICGMVLGIPSIGIAKSLLTGSAVAGGGRDTIKLRGKTVGFVSRDGGARYWSPGYSVSLRQLESIIKRYAPVCLAAMSDSDRAAKEEIRKATGISRPFS